MIWCVAGMTITAACLRLFELGDKSLWLDEAYTAHVIRLPLWQLLQIGDASHMALYYIVMRGWTELAGRSEAMLRLPSALCAIATVPLIYRLGAELTDQRGGLLAALFLTLNATCIEYAQEARTYALVMMMGTLALIFFVRTVKRGTAANALGYVIGSAASIYAHLFATLLVPAEWLSIWFFHAERKTLVRLSACSVVIGLLVVPVLVAAVSTSPGQLATLATPLALRIPRLIAILAGVIDVGVSLPAGIVRWTFEAAAVSLTALYLLAITLALVGAYQGRGRAPVALLTSLTFFPIVATLFMSLIQPFFVYRYMLISLPPFVILAAIGVRHLPSRAMRIAAIAAMTTLGISNDYFYFRAPPLQDWRGAVHFVTTHAKADALVFAYPKFNDVPIGYYVGTDNIPLVPRTNMAELEQDLRPEAISNDIWLVYASWYRLPDAVESAMRDSERKPQETRFPGVGIILLPKPESAR